MAILRCTWPLQPAICEPSLLPVEHVSFFCMVLLAKFGILQESSHAPHAAICCVHNLGIGGDCAHVKREAGPLTWSIQCDCSGPVWSCSWQGVLMRCQGILLGSSPTSWLLRLHLCGASCWPI